MMLVEQFLYSFQHLIWLANVYMPFVNKYWNKGMSVLVLAIFYYLYYVVRWPRADFAFMVSQIVILFVPL